MPLLQRKNCSIQRFCLRLSKILFSGARLTGSRLSRNTGVIHMVPVLLWIQRRNRHKTGTRMPPSRIFVLKVNKMTKTRDNLVPTAPTEAPPMGVGAGGSDYMEVSPKFPGSHLQGYWQVWESFKVHPRVVLVLKARLLSSFQRKTTSDTVSDNQKQLYGSSKTKSFAGGGSTNG